MTRTPPPRKPQKPTPPTPPGSQNLSDGTVPSKPYEFIPFPKERPNLKHPAGHHKYDSNLLHGTLFLSLKVKTSLHVSTGVVVMGSDIGSRVPLIKTMVQGIDKKLSIQGSSLKGCIRSVYEAITNSTLAVITSRYRDKISSERLPCKNKKELCPASQVFGALDWQGLIDFNDARCENTGFSTGFIPSLYSPQPEVKNKSTKEKFLNSKYFDSKGKIRGRKFYYHFARVIDRAERGTYVQQAAKEYTFTTQLHFRNLQPEQLGTLLIVLGQDPKYPIALKVGGGKPIGMGTMTVEVTQAKVLQSVNDLRSRYSQYTPETNNLTGETLQKFIQKQIKTAHSRLIQTPQLQILAEVLRYPTDREPPEGMY